MLEKLLEKIAEIFPPLFNWLHAREIRKGEEEDRNKEEHLTELIELEQKLLYFLESSFTPPSAEREIQECKRNIEFHKEQLKEVQVRLRK